MVRYACEQASGTSITRPRGTQPPPPKLAPAPSPRARRRGWPEAGRGVQRGRAWASLHSRRLGGERAPVCGCKARQWLGGPGHPETARTGEGTRLRWRPRHALAPALRAALGRRLLLLLRHLPRLHNHQLLVPVVLVVLVVPTRGPLLTRHLARRLFGCWRLPFASGGTRHLRRSLRWLRVSADALLRRRSRKRRSGPSSPRDQAAATGRCRRRGHPAPCTSCAAASYSHCTDAKFSWCSP